MRTLRGVALASLALASALASAAPARACSSRYVGLFERAEAARYVAVTRGLANGLRVEESLRGDARSFGVRRDAACPPHPRPRERGLVFASTRRLDAEGDYVVDPTAAQVEAVRAFVAAADDEARRQLLVRHAAGADASLALDAVHLLGMRPALLRAITPEERARLVGSIATADPRLHLGALALVLARLHAVEAVEPLVARLEDRGPLAEVGLAVQLLTLHREPLAGAPDTESESERWATWRQRQVRALQMPWLEPVEPPADAIREFWRAWLETHRGFDPAALWTAAFRERGLRAPDRDDPEALARTMTRAPDDVLRTAALDRCEQLVGRPLSPYRYEAGGIPRWLWAERADACRAAAR